MKFRLTFELEQPTFLSDQSRIWISFFKKATQQYDGEFYQQLFESGRPLSKSYCYSPYFKTVARSRETITLASTTCQLLFSAFDLTEAMLFANAFMGQVHQRFSLPQGNGMTLRRMEFLPSPMVESTELTVKFLSPFLILGNHPTEDDKMWYYRTTDEGFEEAFHRVIATQVQNLAPHLSLEGFKLTPIQPRWTVVHAFEQRCSANFGIYRLQGHPNLLMFLSEAGLGSRRNAGFGLFEVIG